MDPYRSLLQAAVDHHNAGRLAEAEAIYREVLKKKPDHPDALRLLGDIANRIGTPITASLASGANELLPYLARCETPSAASQIKDTLVLGAAVNFHAPKVAPFVRSLREHYSGDAVLLVDSPRLAPFLERHDVRHEVFDIGGNISHVTALRYAMKLQFLTQSTTRYSRILFADVGDVIFQGDPFAIPGDPALVTFEEDRRFTLGTQPQNAEWLEKFFGREIVQAFKEKPVVCSGITIGSADRMMAYLRLQVAFMCTARQDRTAVFGMDQPIHNFIAHMKLIEDFEVRENYGHCAHLAVTDTSRVRMDRDGMIRIDDRPPSAIVHQYNYHKGFAEAIDRRYAADL